MPGASWFPGAELNYAEHALARRDDHPALIARSETRGLERTTTVTYAELARAGRRGPRGPGPARRDARRPRRRLLPNIPETRRRAPRDARASARSGRAARRSSARAAFSTASARSSRRSSSPSTATATAASASTARASSRTSSRSCRRSRPRSCSRTCDRTRRRRGPRRGCRGPSSRPRPRAARVRAVPFEHPLWILYSSGTTGLPKPIVHGHGGILLEHLKALALHQDLGADDRFFWFSTTGWMMWNYLLGGLPLGGTRRPLRRQPGAPGPRRAVALRRATRRHVLRHERAVPPRCKKAGIVPPRRARSAAAARASARRARRCRRTASTGCTSASERTVLLGSRERRHRRVHGVRALVPAPAGARRASSSARPRREGRGVRRGRRSRSSARSASSCITRAAAVDAAVLLERPRRRALPRELLRRCSRASGGTATGSSSTPTAASVIYGRSDSTLNRGGVRMGTSEFYRVVEALPEITDSLVVDIGGRAARSCVLFVVPRAGRDARRRAASGDQSGAARRSCRRATCRTASARCPTSRGR